jgi:hypothetical protein
MKELKGRFDVKKGVSGQDPNGALGVPGHPVLYPVEKECKKEHECAPGMAVQERTGRLRSVTSPAHRGTTGRSGPRVTSRVAEGRKHEPEPVNMGQPAMARPKNTNPATHSPAVGNGPHGANVTEPAGKVSRSELENVERVATVRRRRKRPRPARDCQNVVKTGRIGPSAV